MTVIAWDGRFLAADTRFSVGGTGIVQGTPDSKLLYADGRAYGASGRIVDTHLSKLAEWWRDGAGIGEMPGIGQGNTENFGNFLVISADAAHWQCWCIAYCAPYPWKLGAPAGIGSGSEYAIGAMEGGANAMTAVRIACKHDSSCALPIDFWDSLSPEEGIQRRP
jgi:hypothetical protein